MAGKLKRDIARKKLAGLLSSAEAADILLMIWCVDRLRSGATAAGAKGFDDLPKDFPRRLQENRFLLLPWLLEDMANEKLTLPYCPKRAKNRRLNCRSFGAFINVYNAMHSVDNAESGYELSRGRDVLQAMPRYGHRQFDWQQGWMNAPVMYRSMFLYGQGECEAWFREEHGLTPAEFVLFCIGAHMAMLRKPYVRASDLTVPELDLDERIVRCALALACKPVDALGRDASEVRDPRLNVVARPSVFRRTPLIEMPDGMLFSPLPDLLMERATAGLYLDLVKAPSGLRNVIGERFEQYAFELLELSFHGAVRREYEYRHNKGLLRTPDILIGGDEALELIVECKATRMSFAARFSDDWRTETGRGYTELAKGVGQIWRHCSHMRRGLVPDRRGADMVGLVLTLDPWMRMTFDQDKIILEEARAWCASTDPEIMADDECPICFTDVRDLEQLVHRTDEQGILKVLRASSDKVGWGGNELASIEGVKEVKRPYTFRDRLGEVLTWYDRLGEKKDRTSRRLDAS